MQIAEAMYEQEAVLLWNGFSWSKSQISEINFTSNDVKPVLDQSDCTNRQRMDKIYR